MDTWSLRFIAGQVAGLIALTLCIIGFASKRDDRLFVLLIFANVAFAAQFALFKSWVAAGITTLIVLRVALVRRYKWSWTVMALMLAATVIIAALTWERWVDVWALAAGMLGTFGMFMLEGIAMRVLLAIAACCWAISNALIGSVGGTLAESLIFVTNAVTIFRLARDRNTGGTRGRAKG